MKDGSPPLSLRVAGCDHAIASDPARRLSEVLREELGLRSVKIGCDAGDCGACTILVDGVQHCACLMPVGQAAGAEIETLETLSDPLIARLKESFLDHGAAQCGICTPGVMMAAIELLREAPAPSEAQVHEALGGVLCRCTGYRKIIEAICALDAPAVETRAEAGRAVGAPVRRVDGRAKVDGTEVYGADHVPPGTLLVRAVRSPHFHADFELGDVSTWGAGRDVIVLTARDVPGENRFGTIPGLEDQPAIAEARVRFLGEPVALVVGAPDVVEPLDLSSFPVVWHPLDHSLTEAEGAADDAPQLHDHRPENTLIRGRVVSGAPEEALAGSRHVARGRFETSYVEHAYIEPEAGIAWLDDDTLVIQACTQAPVLDRDETAKVLGLPRDKVRIIPAAAGGGFGAKLDLSVQPLIGLATLATGQTSSSTNLFVADGRNLVAVRFTFDFGCYGPNFHEANLNYLSLWFTFGRDYGLHDGEWKMVGGRENSNSIIISSEPLTVETSTWLEVPEYSALYVSSVGDKRSANTVELTA